MFGDHGPFIFAAWGLSVIALGGLVFEILRRGRAADRAIAVDEETA